MTHDDHQPEPVLVNLSAPARRSLVVGLVRPEGATPGPVERIDADIPDPELAAYLAGIAHADHGFVAHTTSGPRALAVLAATVAALCGDDIPTALTTPDLPFLRSLKPAAIEATRTVLLAIETPAEREVSESLQALDAP